MIDIEVEETAWTQALADPDGLARTAAAAALGALSATGAVTILLADDDSVADLNARFRGKQGPTNVLSFPAPENPEAHLGDIALAFGVCQAEAQVQGKRLEDHLQHLVVHGVLHLLGLDHMTDIEAEEMEALERQVLQGIGVPDPYAAEADEDG